MYTAADQIPHVIEVLAPIVNQYGYFAVALLVMLEGFGVPTPGMTVIIASAFFAGLGHLSLVLVGLVAFLGAIVGDSIGFAIGKYAGEPLVERLGKYIWLTPDRIRASKEFFKKRGGGIILIARFVDGLRQLNGIIAGLSGMRWTKFLVFNIIGAAVWVTTWSIAGYFGGRHIQAFIEVELYIAIGFAVAIIAFVAYKLIRRRQLANN